MEAIASPCLREVSGLQSDLLYTHYLANLDTDVLTHIVSRFVVFFVTSAGEVGSVYLIRPPPFPRSPRGPERSDPDTPRLLLNGRLDNKEDRVPGRGFRQKLFD